MRVERGGRLQQWLGGLLCTALAGWLGLVVLGLPREPGGLTGLVRERLPESGVTNPVTGVLLNFRAYDTWLEVAVLLYAMVGVFVLTRSWELPARGPVRPVSPLLPWAAGVLVPVAVVAAGYLLWRGTFAPGGAFQAGAVLAAVLILLRTAGRAPLALLAGIWGRVVLASGVALFVVIAVGTWLWRGRMLELPVGWANTVIVVLELGVVLAIAFTLASLYLVGAESRRLGGEAPGPHIDPQLVQGDMGPERKGTGPKGGGA